MSKTSSSIGIVMGAVALVAIGVAIGTYMANSDRQETAEPRAATPASASESEAIEVPAEEVDRPVQTRLASELPRRAENFRLTDHLGRSHELDRYASAKAVVLYTVGNGCPIVRQNFERLKELREEYKPKGVEFFMINAFPQDTRRSVAEEAATFAVNIPILVDEAQLITASLGTQRTGEALVLDPSDDWAIKYRGAIDDRLDYGTKLAEPKNHWLKAALDSFLEGKPIELAQTKTKGCAITMQKLDSPYTYTQDVAPIIQNNCVKCHTEGNIAPFAFRDFENVTGWGAMIREVVRTKRMPPWFADPEVGEFKDDHSLTPEQERTLVSWVENGMPRGEGDDPLATTIPNAPEKWALGTPDLVVDIPQQVNIPAEGVFDYIYMRVPLPVDHDIWVRAVDVQPSNAEVAHHVLVFLRYPDELEHLQEDMRGGLNGFFAGYVPGMQRIPYPEGTGKFVPKGSEFVFQLHYNATGKAETDFTQMAIYLHEDKPKRQLFTHAANNTDFSIPPKSRDHEVSASYRMRRDVMLWGVMPHMHYRGSRVAYEAHYPDGKVEPLLSVPNYNFDWQIQYQFKEPKLLPEGTQIVCTGAFDNSESNPFNPDPERWVRFGEQTWEEMFIGYVSYSPVAEIS
jgi:redoxin